MNFAMATLGLKELGKFLCEGREKGLTCWLSQFSKTKLRQPTQILTIQNSAYGVILDCSISRYVVSDFSIQDF